MRRLWLFTSLLLMAGPAQAVPTSITIHVLSHDAKLIGDLSGGARVRLSDADTGAPLVEGTHWGETGDTGAIIRTPYARGTNRFDSEGAASFTASLDLDAPTWITAEAWAPLGFPSARAHASQTFLVIPGQDIGGEGIVLELYGLIVNILSPAAESPPQAGSTVRVEAGVKLLCTCPIEPGGLWDADHYTVTAQLWNQDRLVAESALAYAGRTNVFAGDLAVPADAKVLELRILASNADRQNHGMDRSVFRLRQP